MNLLKTIIERLNQRIEVANIFDKQFGLCELNANGNEKAWVHYIGNGQAEVVTNFDAKQGTLFWAKRGKVTVVKTDAFRVSGCKQLYITSFPLTAYAVVRKSHLPCDSEDAQDWLASRIYKITSGTDPAFKQSIGVINFEVVPSGYINEIKTLTANYEWACVSVDFDVQVITTTEDGCYDICQTGDIPLPDLPACTPCLTEVAVDGVTIIGNGTAGDPLSAIGAGGGAIVVEDEGIEVTPVATTLNFTGEGVTASLTSPGVVEVNVPGGGGGVGTLQDVTDLGNSTTNDIDFIANAGLTFDNGALFRKGTTDAGNGGAKGTAQICSISYELKWEAGRLYYMEQNGFTIRDVTHNFTFVPQVTDDSTKGFVVGSRWSLDDGTVYLCSDATIGAAVWAVVTVGGVTSVTASLPLSSTGGTTPDISITQADSSTDGYLSSTDWNTFDGKFDVPTGTITDYLDGLGTPTAFPAIPSVTPSALTKTDDTNVTLSLGGSPSTSLLAATSLTLGWNGTLADSRITSAATWNAKQNAITTGTTLQYFRGDLSLDTFPTALPPSGAASGDLNGTYPSPEVHKIHGVDMQSGTPTTDDLWIYGGAPAKWRHGKIKTINSTTLIGSGNIAVEPVITAGTTLQYYRGDKTFQTLDKSAVGLGNVDNTSDVNKPVSSATQTALNAKQDTLVSGTNIKTINSTSILGSGDITTGSVTSVAALTLGTSGTDLSSSVATGTTTPVITLNVPTASAANRGALSAADWTTFNGKQAAITPAALTKVNDTNVTLTLGGSPTTALLQGVSITAGWSGTLADARITSAATWNAKQNAITLTTTGTSGAATLVGATLNIPQYSGSATNYKSITDTAGFSSITNTAVYTQLIPANTYGIGDIIRVTYRTRKTGTSGNQTLRIYVNSTADLSGTPILLGTYNNTGANAFLVNQMLRHLAIKSSTNNTEVFLANGATFFSDYGLYNAVTTCAIDWTATKYFVFALQNSNAVDVNIGSMYLIEKL